MNKLNYFGEAGKPQYETPSVEIMDPVIADVICASIEDFNDQDVDWFNKN